VTAPLTFAYSPCPNDTYMFAALAAGLIPDAPAVRAVLDDVEALNTAALAGRFEFTKVSYGAIPHLVDRYRVLRAGGALGRGCGPLLVARSARDDSAGPLEAVDRSWRIAIPGRLTTAYLLLRLALGFEPQSVEMRFDRIIDAVARAEVDAGLIIHESRFTYGQAGLVPVADLGAWWEAATGAPIPLGALLARRDLDAGTVARVDDAIRRSLAFARSHEDRIIDDVRAHAFEMDDTVMRQHIALYVNEFSDDVGDAGIAAVNTLFERCERAGFIAAGRRPEFVAGPVRS